MRYYTSEELYETYFYTKYSSYRNMISNFCVLKSKDKEGKFKNVTYLDFEKIDGKKAMYSDKDLKEYIRNADIAEQKVHVAKQLLVELEFLLEEFNIEGYKTYIIKFFRLTERQLTYLDFKTQEVADKIITRMFLFVLLLPNEIRQAFQMKLKGV